MSSLEHALVRVSEREYQVPKLELNSYFVSQLEEPYEILCIVKLPVYVAS